MKIYIKKEINPFNKDRLEWSVRVPDWEWKFYNKYLSNVLDELEDRLQKDEEI